MVRDPVRAAREALERFHTAEYIEKVQQGSQSGKGLLDYGDTPAFTGCFDASATVVGSALDAVAQIMDGAIEHAFVPIAGLHHARRDIAGGFCIFNDVGVVIETLKSEYGLERIAYVEIDAHHGDGVYYSFEDDPAVIFADIHEDGRFLYPGTGFAYERGKGPGVGNKLNIPVMPGSDDEVFFREWENVEALLEESRPE